MWDYLNKRPLLLCAVAASVISVIGMYSETALFIICLAIVVLFFFAVYKKIKGELIFALLMVLLVGISAIFVNGRINKAQNCDGSVCEGEFVVVESPVNHGSIDSVTLEVVKSNLLKKGERLNVILNDSTLDFAQKIKAEIKIYSMENSEHKESFYAEEVYLRGNIRSFEDLGESESVLSAVKKIRAYIRDEIFLHYGEEESATVLALVTGDKTYFTEEFYGNVKSAGVAHVMVVSGMHLSVFVMMFLYLCNKFFYNRFLKAATIFAVTASVMAVCGFTMSIQRAALTYILMAIALLFNRENTPENTLGAAVTVILLINPFAVFSVAFVLSVLSTFAILVVAIPVTEALKEKGIIKKKHWITIVSAVIISISTLIFTAPVVIKIFGYVSNVSIITNLLVGAPSNAAMIICVLGFVFPFAKGLLFAVGNIIINYVNRVINFFGSQKYAVTVLPDWAAWVAVAAVIIVLYILLACKVKKDMLKLEKLSGKKSEERGRKAKWQRFWSKP